MVKGQFKDVTGKRYGRLVAIERIGVNKFGKAVWRCRCDCGQYSDVSIGNLTSGCTLSCGCLHKETFNRKTHGETNTRLYRIWCAMKDRCSRKGAINYKYYGGKGIRVCDEWSSFQNFREWAIENGYSDNLTIDRIDSSADYRPDNCRWITLQENARISAKAMQKRRKENKICTNT